MRKPTQQQQQQKIIKNSFRWLATVRKEAIEELKEKMNAKAGTEKKTHTHTPNKRWTWS